MEKVDCIIVGGGLAGLSAAYGLASEGLEVMVIERGDYAGAKNVTGGRLYVSPIRHLYPELWETAPFERPVVRELVTLMGDGAHTTVELASERFATPPHQSYTVLRARLDQWFADQVMEKGGMVITKNRVDDLLLEDGKVIGIRAGGDDIGADVTIIAEGVLGLLAAKAGLREEPKPEDHAVGFKEIIELPAGVIQDRWRLNEGEGAAHLFMGSVTRGMLGGGFIYTNKDSLCVGIVVGMEHLRRDTEQMESYKLLDAFKEMPLIKPLVDGGTTVEYSAHAIYEGGIAKMPKLYGDGYLLVGDTAGLSLNALVTVRGMDFAIASGYYAARAVRRRPRPRRFLGLLLGAVRAVAQEQFRAQGPGDGPGDTPHHREPAALQPLPAGGVAADGAGVHHRPGTGEEALQHGHRRCPQGLPQRDHHQRAPRHAEDLKGC